MSAVAREVYVISDLHLGGPVGFRMMRHPDVLAAFIKGITCGDSPPKELVIAGDFVDFLAEGTAPDGEIPSQWAPLVEDASLAEALLKRIALNSSYKIVFEALSDFLRAKHRLTILLGNHDIELSYPRVRSALGQVLGTEEGQGFRFVYDGEAYIVGDALIEHGNRYDRWNQVDHDSLRRLRSLQSRGQEAERPGLFKPPAGSRLVANVMNPIKRDYPFVDLLKPENEAVLPILLALEPSYKRMIADAVRALTPGVARGVGKDGIPVRLADASGAQQVEDGSFGDPLEVALGNALQGNRGDGRMFLFQVDGGPRMADASAASIAKGLLRILAAGKSIDERLPPLRLALRAVQADRSFDPTFEPDNSPYLEAAKRLANRTFRYVVFGHTHHAKSITLSNGSCQYFNTGTWADLMQVPAAIFSQDAEKADTALREFVEAIRQGNLECYRKFTPTYVRLAMGANGLVCESGLHIATEEMP